MALLNNTEKGMDRWMNSCSLQLNGKQMGLRAGTEDSNKNHADE